MTEREKARGVRIAGSAALVTGGAGTIGSHVVDALVSAGAAEVVVLDNLSRGSRANLDWALAHGPVRLVDGDIRDRATVQELCRGKDVVFHLAAIRITQCAEKPRLAKEVLVDGTFNVLEVAAAERVRKVVASSSASVYGMADTFPTTERHHPYNDDTLYGAAKAFNEGLLRSFHCMYGLDYVALRYFSAYGPRMDTHGVYTEVLIRWMDCIGAGRPPVIFGDGGQTIDLVHVRDIARANILAAEADVSAEVFNVATGVETSLTDLAAALAAVMETDVAPEYAPARAVNGVRRRTGDTTAARCRLGFEASIGLRDGLRNLVAWWRDTRAPVAALRERIASRADQVPIRQQRQRRP